MSHLDRIRERNADVQNLAVLTDDHHRTFALMQWAVIQGAEDRAALVKFLDEARSTVAKLLRRGIPRDANGKFWPEFTQAECEVLEMAEK